MSTPTISLDGQLIIDTHSAHAVEGTNSAPATQISTSKAAAPVRSNLPADQIVCDAQRNPVGGDLSSDDGHHAADLQGCSAVVAPTPPAPANTGSSPRSLTPVLADPLLALAADVLDDLERVRIANENRLRQLTRDETDTDGEERGFGLTLDHPDVKRLAALVDALAKAEHDAELNLKRQLRQHPLGPWVKQARGVGEKQAARLLAAVGDPYWNDLYDRPRLVSELWSYCGYGDAAKQVRRRGEKANWSADAKMRAFLVSVSIVKAGGPYREVYDAARAKYDGALHPAECKRCGPAGSPALPGSPISPGHQHARALRAVSKAVLHDLWVEAKRLHESP